MHAYTMSEISVNEHLEGILSDFEALKRSFDIEDADDVPPFSPPSSLFARVSPSPSHPSVNHNNPIESIDKSGMPPSLAYNNNNNNSLVSAAHHSHISSNPSPILKPRNLSSSLSFNRATMIKPAIHNNGSSVIRASSFQSRLNPNGLMTWPGNNDNNDSLHSSTSSLEYSGSVGGCLSPSKPGLFPRIFPEEEYHLPQFPQLPPEKNENFENKLQPKKFSSFGNVSHSEKDQDSGIRLGVSHPSGINHCSITSLDLPIPDEEGGLANMHRGRGGDQMSPNIRHNNANWNGRHVNATAYGEETYCGTRNHQQQKVTQILKASHLKVKETPRLNKFPLDLDSLVNSTSAIKVQGQSMSLHQPRPLPMSTVDHLYHPNPPSTTVSSSASLSSLESSSDTSFQHSYLSVFPCSLTPSQDTIKGPPACSPISTEQGPQTKISLGYQGVPSVSNQSGSYSLQGNKSNLSLRDVESEASDSVGSILQRIASFSQHATPDIIQAGMQYKLMQSNAGLSSPSEIKNMWKQEVKKEKETCGKPEAAPTISMEDTQKDKCIMGQVQEGDGTTQEQPANMITQDSVMVKEGLNTEKEERGTEKGMDEGELQKEVQLEAGLKMEYYHSDPGRQLNYIHGADLFGYVGIEAVLDQMRNKTMKVGFDFNIMVVGQSGLGKSTLVNTLFKSKVSRKSCAPEYEAKISKTVKLQKISHVIEEKGVKMKLTVIDTPGFGDQINNDNCWEPIVKYVNEQYEKYLREELNVTRKRRIPDSRVHCCIYFLPATGHRLRSIDIEFMKRLGRIVSIVPVIAKADTLTIEERQEFKERIRQDLASNGISVYPQKEYDEDPQERIINDRIRENIPFAVVGTDKEHQVNGNKVLGRKTKWGIIEVENVEHCEFAYLRDLLIRSHLQDLKDVTNNIHYETYRMQRLNESNVNFTEAGLSTWLRDHRTAERSGNESHF